MKPIHLNDFYAMNKTMLNFNTQKPVVDDTKEPFVFDGTPTSAKVPLNPAIAFRHTEYGKGFYKVSDEKSALAALETS